MKVIVVVFLVALGVAYGDPIWKVFHTQDPLYRGRADPIVSPGNTSLHSHKVWGASNFGVFSASTSPVAVYNTLRKSKCNTCTLSVDMSNYWIPDLYYQWGNGSLSLVPVGGLTVYYLSRGGKPYTAFPPGLRVVAGNPFLRTFNSSDFHQTAITFVCLSSQPSGASEQSGFPTDKYFCADGLRAQVFFPMCWDGVNLDSPDHKSHMAYPIQGYNGGDCPSDHPVKVPGVFYEILFSVSAFPHGTGKNPFVLACGDTTGFGLHGDFLNGWNQSVVQAALQDPSCDLALNPNLNFGNNVSACDTLRPYLTNSNFCPLATPIPSVEDLGINHVISQLPGCNALTSGPAMATPCTASSTNVTIPSYVKRVLIQSTSSQLYVFCGDSNNPLTANTTASSLTRANVFNFFPIPGGFSIVSEGLANYYVTSDNYNSNFLISNRYSPSGWETFTFNTVTGGSTITASSNGKFVSLQTTGTLASTAATNVAPTAKEIWRLIPV